MEREYSINLKTLADELKLTVVSPSSDYDQVKVTTGDVHRPGLQLAGFYDYFDPTRIQLVGRMETAFLTKFPDDERRDKVDFFLSKKMPALIICHDAEILPEFIEAAAKYDVTLLSTSLNTSGVLSELIWLIKKALAPRVTRHGVLVEVYGLGILLMGESGVGKSEAAIELLKRGHRLIADNAVEIKAVDHNQLQGTAPELIRHYVELRGIGVIDVRQIFGVGAVKERQNIHLVVNLEPWREGMLYDRLGISEQTMSILGVDVPSVTIPVKPGRNLAIILEVAAMNQRQKFMGYNAAQEFTRQINKHFDEKLS
ncbi:HPr(Ser) kinase/phosphatase [Oscillospiraceae bacterium CM]|nr:HPr(Ser) kinase/phosphatase [Oscillospiraceae bacterium CM]